jgi:hypothetical protein
MERAMKVPLDEAVWIVSSYFSMSSSLSLIGIQRCGRFCMIMWTMKKCADEFPEIMRGALLVFGTHL